MKKFIALFLVVIMLVSLFAGCTMSEEQLMKEANKYYEKYDYAKQLLKTGKELLSYDDAASIKKCSALVKALKASPSWETAYDVSLQLTILSCGQYRDPATLDEIAKKSEEALTFIQDKTKITMDQVPWWSFSKSKSVRTLFQKGQFAKNYPPHIDWLIAVGLNLWG